MRSPRTLLAAILALSCVAEEPPAVTVRRSAPLPRPRAEPIEAPAPDAADDLPPLAPQRPLAPGAYDLGKLPVFSKVLFYVRENYFDKSRFNYRNMMLGALDFVQRDVPEVVVGRDGDRIMVSVAGHQAGFSLRRIDQPWSLRSKLQQVLQFVQENISAVPREAVGPHLLEIEMAAVNGMLYTLDPHSVLLDTETYAGMRRPAGDLSASVGVVLAVDAAERIAIVDVLPDSPAASAGIAAGDRIVLLDGDATQNMALGEVVDRLRGPVGSTVEVVVEGGAHRSPQKLTLARALVFAPSIAPAPRVLTDKVAYLRLRHLSRGASADVREALRAFAQKGEIGVILDLRGNSGGLYEEAHKVVDEFVDQGTIVSMVGPGGSPRKDENATGTAMAPLVPLVVLVDHDTASGAEVIAAAVKNLGRGVVIGEPTVGMGTVQVLFDVPSPLAKGPDDFGMLGLKLTTAQMLTAGGAPLQTAGVEPDIPVAPMTVSTNESSPSFHLQPSRHYRNERDYEWSLPPVTRPRREPPPAVIPYVREIGTRTDSDPDRVADPETDSLVALGRGLLHQTKGLGRRQLLASSEQFLTSWRAEQDARLTAALARRGIDWTVGPAGPTPPLQMTLERLPPLRGTHPQPLRVRGVVKNTGREPAFRVRAVIESDNSAFDEAELVFGKIAPGESKSYDLSVAPPIDAPGTALLHAALIAQDRPLRETADLLFEVAGAPSATLSFRYQVREAAHGSNHNGRIERGDRIEIPVTVTNTGSEGLSRVRARLLGPQSADRVSIPAGRFAFGELRPGASKTATFAAVIPPGFGPEHCDLRIELEPDSGDWTQYPVRVDVSGAVSAVPARAGGAAVVEVNPPRLLVRGPAVVASDTVLLEGTASGAHGIHDLYIRVWSRHIKIPVRKVFYQLNSPSDSPEMAFQAEVPLAPGANLIQVLARQSVDATTLRTIVVLRAPTPAPTRTPTQQ